MSETEPPKLAIGLLVGIATGALGLLFGQMLLRGDDEAKGAPSDGGELERLQADLAAGEARIGELEKENRRLAGEMVAALDRAPGAGKISIGEEGSEEEKADGGAGMEGFFKAMMQAGAPKAKQEVEAKVASLAERLNLSEPQQEELRQALAARMEKQQSAGILVITGKATIADLLDADEDNFTEVDTAMLDILSESQLEEYANVQHEREEKRVEKKANEDLAGLQQIDGITEQQADGAWEVFVELNAAEKPGSLPAETTPEEFNAVVDEAIDNRIERMTPILTPAQLDAYRGQTEAFRTMISALISGATGAAER